MGNHEADRDRLLKEARLIQIEYRKYAGRIDPWGEQVRNQLRDRYREIDGQLANPVPMAEWLTLEVSDEKLQQAQPMSLRKKLSAALEKGEPLLLVIAALCMVVAVAIPFAISKANSRSEGESPLAPLQEVAAPATTATENSASYPFRSREELNDYVLSGMANEAGVSKEEMREQLNESMDRYGVPRSYGRFE